MTERNGPPDNDGYGTSTEGAASPDSSPDDETVENPVGFGEDSGSTEVTSETTSIESGEEGGRTSIEEPV